MAAKAKDSTPNPTADANRTLDVLLNLILTMSEASLAYIYIPRNTDLLADLFVPPKAPGVPTLNRQSSKDMLGGIGVSSLPGTKLVGFLIHLFNMQMGVITV